VLKTCLTALALSVAGLANAQAADMTPDQMLTYSVISGGAVNIAAQPDYVTAPNVGGHLAGRAAVTIGAFTTVNDIYAGAAVTTGASSRVKQIYAGAAAGVGANAFALDVDAGAAVVVGANGQIGKITAGAAITLGAGVGHMVGNDYTGVVTRGAGSSVDDYSDDYAQWTIDAGTATGSIKIADDMKEAMSTINTMLARTEEVNPYNVITYADLSNDSIVQEGDKDTFYYSAISLQANTELKIVGDVTVITSGAMTIGAGANIELVDGATVTWILGGALNLGAGTTFSGETYVKGAINGATSDVECGNLYATGAVSVRTIGNSCTQPTPQISCPAFTKDELIDSGDFTYRADIVDISVGRLDMYLMTKRFDIRVSISDTEPGSNYIIHRYETDGMLYKRYIVKRDLEPGQWGICVSLLNSEIDRRNESGMAGS
jgi:hypothetical protein